MNWPLKIFDYTIIGLILIGIIVVILPFFGGIDGQQLIAWAALIGLIFLLIGASFLVKLVQK